MKNILLISLIVLRLTRGEVLAFKDREEEDLSTCHCKYCGVPCVKYEGTKEFSDCEYTNSNAFCCDKPDCTATKYTCDKHACDYCNPNTDCRDFDFQHETCTYLKQGKDPECCDSCLKAKDYKCGKDKCDYCEKECSLLGSDQDKQECQMFNQACCMNNKLGCKIKLPFNAALECSIKSCDHCFMNCEDSGLDREEQYLCRLHKNYKCCEQFECRLLCSSLSCGYCRPFEDPSNVSPKCDTPMEADFCSFSVEECCGIEDSRYCKGMSEFSCDNYDCKDCEKDCGKDGISNLVIDKCLQGKADCCKEDQKCNLSIIRYAGFPRWGVVLLIVIGVIIFGIPVCFLTIRQLRKVCIAPAPNNLISINANREIEQNFEHVNLQMVNHLHDNKEFFEFLYEHDPYNPSQKTAHSTTASSSVVSSVELSSVPSSAAPLFLPSTPAYSFVASASSSVESWMKGWLAPPPPES